MVWLLPTTGRPQLCQETLDVCEAVGMDSPGWVFVDGTTPETEAGYHSLRLPANWSSIIISARRGIGYSMEWLLRDFPKAAFYGWIADDVRPLTKGFDKLLEQATERTKFACCDDRLLSLTPSTRQGIESGSYMSGSALCWGGDYVRAVGWWKAPFLEHVGIDAAWDYLNQATGRYVYLKDVVCEHHNWKSGKRPKDATDAITFPETELYQRDLRQLILWRQSQTFVETVQRVKERLG